MGNYKTPRPKNINFPEVTKKIDYKFEIVSSVDGKDQRYVRSILGLKSGNILIAYLEINQILDEIKNCLEIVNVPKLKKVEEFKFNSIIDDVVYGIDSALQLKNGNIFTICDRFYFFDGENISKGPKTKSEEINNIYFLKNFNKEFKYVDRNFNYEKSLIKRDFKCMPCDFIIEAKENKLLYTFEDDGNKSIRFFDISNLSEEPNQEVIFTYSKKGIYSMVNYHFDIIKVSEYYPENLYVIGNMKEPSGMSMDNHSSLLFIFNLDDFCDVAKKDKKPESIINISKSQIIVALCEYDKKYLLLDTFNNGIYIIDIEAKAKVAVATDIKILENNILLSNKKETFTEKEYGSSERFDGLLYRNIIKLKDGQILLNYYWAEIMDISEQRTKRVARVSQYFVFLGNYMIICEYNTALIAYQIFDE
jgi:hypothetical protein